MDDFANNFYINRVAWGHHAETSALAGVFTWCAPLARIEPDAVRYCPATCCDGAIYLSIPGEITKSVFRQESGAQGMTVRGNEWRKVGFAKLCRQSREVGSSFIAELCDVTSVILV